MSNNRYLFFVSVAYSYPILRPLQAEIRRRGGEVAWYVEPTCPVMLEQGERRLRTVSAVMEWNPVAVFTPGNYVYDFFPGIKVSLFHGYPINKRADEVDDHFAVRGWFDIYCTQGESSTRPFRRLEEKYGYFKVYETGWCKADAYAGLHLQERPRQARPVVLYSTTFTKNITSAPALYDTVARLARTREWDWVLSFHPKFRDAELLDKYRALAAELPNVTFHEGGLVDAALLQQADVLLSDASSVIVEFMLLDRPVVTYRNTAPGPHLLNVTEAGDVEAAIDRALTRPAALMEQERAYVHRHEGHLDGHSCARVLDAVDDYLAHQRERLAPKPWNLLRKFKLRLRTGYPLVALPRGWAASL